MATLRILYARLGRLDGGNAAEFAFVLGFEGGSTPSLCLACQAMAEREMARHLNRFPYLVLTDV